MSTTHAVGVPGPREARPSKFLSLPHTKSGRLSMWLGVTFVVLLGVDLAVLVPILEGAGQETDVFRVFIFPVYGVSMLLCGFVAGVIGLSSITRDRERSWAVWLTFVPMMFVISFILGEILLPH